MLVLTTADNITHTWRVNTPLPSEIFVEGASPVVALWATDHELKAIREQFTSIPMHRANMVLWRNEFAQFIIDNLQIEYTKTA